MLENNHRLYNFNDYAVLRQLYSTGITEARLLDIATIILELTGFTALHAANVADNIAKRLVRENYLKIVKKNCEEKYCFTNDATAFVECYIRRGKVLKRMR